MMPTVLIQAASLNACRRWRPLGGTHLAGPVSRLPPLAVHLRSGACRGAAQRAPVGLHHALHELLEAHLRLPSEAGARLLRVTDAWRSLRRAHQRGIDAQVAL